MAHAGGLRRPSPGLVSLVLNRGVSIIVSAPPRNIRRRGSNFIVHHGTVRANIGILADLSATRTLIADLRGASLGRLALMSVTAVSGQWWVMGSIGWGVGDLQVIGCMVC